MKQQVYFIRARGGDFPIKIGCSIDPAKRIAGLGEWVPYRLELLASLPGSYALEAALHNMFADDWLAGEWFRETDRLLAIIERVKAGLPIEVSANPNARDGERRAIIRQKKQWSRKLTGAEIAAHGRDFYFGPVAVRNARRPAEIAAVCERYGNVNAPPPNAAESVVLMRYLAELQQMAT